jgi:hypothetical protein
MTPKFLSRLALSLALLPLALSAPAQITAPPNAFTFQGRLTTPAGNPVPDGTYTLHLGIHTAATDGTVLADQTFSNVAVKNGTFSVIFNNFTTDKFNGNAWLSIRIGNEQAQSPRIPIVSVPYAVKSNLALTVPDNAITGAKIADGSITAAKLAGGVVSGQAWTLTGNSITDGQFFGTTNTLPLIFKTNGVEQMRLLANGNVGIGTASPASKLDVAGETRTTTLTVPNLLAAALAVGSALDQGQTSGATTGEDTMWQSFRPGVTGELEQLELRVGKTGSGSGTFTLEIREGEGAGGAIVISQSITVPSGTPSLRIFNISGTNRLTAGQQYSIVLNGPTLLFGYSSANPYSRGRSNINSASDVAFRTYMSQPAQINVASELNLANTLNLTSTTARLYALRISNPATTYQTGMQVTDDGFFQITNDINGGAFARLNSSGTWTSTSDRRMKNSIEPLEGLLDKALKLQPVSYFFNGQKREQDPNRHIGFVAQDVEPLFPSLVAGTEIKSLDYSGFGVVAIGALQEMNRKMDADRKRLQSLEAENAALRQRLDTENAELRRRLDALEALLTQRSHR